MNLSHDVVLMTSVEFWVDPLLHGTMGEGASACTSSVEAQSPAVAVLTSLRRLAPGDGKVRERGHGGWQCARVATRVESPQIGVTRGLFPFLSSLRTRNTAFGLV